MEKDKVISLNTEQINCIKDILNDGYEGYYEDGCLCGYYEFFIENLGFIAVKTSCRKSIDCPSGMSWFVSDEVAIFSNSISFFGYFPNEEDLDEYDEVQLLGYLDETNSKLVKQLVRESIIENHSWRNCDEFGEETKFNLKDYDNKSMNSLDWLQKWYKSHCNGDWEHSNGLEIGTLDNPGWYINIDLTDTELENKPFEELKIDRNSHNWIICKVEDNMFKAFGGPLNLSEITEIFKDWYYKN